MNERSLSPHLAYLLSRDVATKSLRLEPVDDDEKTVARCKMMLLANCVPRKRTCFYPSSLGMERYKE